MFQAEVFAWWAARAVSGSAPGLGLDPAVRIDAVIILDVEDYVQPADLEKALKAGRLWDRVYTPDLSKPLPTMLDLVNPTDGTTERKQRVIVTSENHAHQAPWLIGSYDLMQETPYTFTAINQFNCGPNRGVTWIAPMERYAKVNIIPISRYAAIAPSTV
jgi:hypothetical protein